MTTQYLHAMIRTTDPDASHVFYTKGLNLIQTRRYDSDKGKFSLIYYASEEGAPEIELTYNWDDRDYKNGDQFGHLAFRVDDIYTVCANLESMGVIILRPPRDGHMAFVKDPNGISIELLQAGESLSPQEPWASMESTGSW
ncbi:VOC family protein [Marinomonas balearica]|uniref:Aldoketomutase n=1 Tax=Marinomonas balearica TaxID=491947 RepID=A0A4R6MDW4_9GAMM|nr:VOC family protein [Marinomonas balearica]TDO99773.1 lactoylglutathione lyase [Marinomonas balearica]